jgi:hypothetical protein
MAFCRGVSKESYVAVPARAPHVVHTFLTAKGDSAAA